MVRDDPNGCRVRLRKRATHPLQASLFDGVLGLALDSMAQAGNQKGCVWSLSNFVGDS